MPKNVVCCDFFWKKKLSKVVIRLMIVGAPAGHLTNCKLVAFNCHV